jgi:WD40 repeat protein
MIKKRIFCALISFAIVSVSTICLSREETRLVQRQPNHLSKVVFIPQKNQIAGLLNAGENGSLVVWSIDGTKTHTFDFEKGVWGASIAVSNKGDSVVLGLVGEPDLMLYSLIEKRPVWKVKGIEKGFGLSSVSFTPDDNRVVVVGFKNIVIFDSKSGAILQRQEDSEAFSFGLPRYRSRIDKISHTGRYAAFFQGNVEVHNEARLKNNVWITVYDIESKKLVAKQAYVQKSYKNCSAVFTQDERNLVLGSLDGFVRVWSITDQKVIRQWKAYENSKATTFREIPFPNPIDSVILSSDGRLLATIGSTDAGSSIKVWEYATNRQVHEFRDVISSSLTMCSGYPMAFSPDGKYFAFEQQGTLCLYATRNWEQMWCVPSWPEGKQ